MKPLRYSRLWWSLLLMLGGFASVWLRRFLPPDVAALISDEFIAALGTALGLTGAALKAADARRARRTGEPVVLNDRMKRLAERVNAEFAQHYNHPAKPQQEPAPAAAPPADAVMALLTVVTAALLSAPGCAAAPVWDRCTATITDHPAKPAPAGVVEAKCSRKLVCDNVAQTGKSVACDGAPVVEVSP